MFPHQLMNLIQELLTLPPGKYTISLRGKSPFDKSLCHKVKVTVLDSARQNGWSFNGFWFRDKPILLEASRHYVLPVREYRKRISSAFWIGFIVAIEKEWHDEK